ncbi:MAG: DUF4125 family protein [Lachnospiraceae bacterium]|nr:DUF4125 family protein [Lachnospiraceae bacterium]
MDINKVLIEYDSMFGNFGLSEIEEFLVENIELSKEEKDLSSQFTLLNEVIGFCRDTTQRDKAIMYCSDLLELMEEMKLEGTVEYATALLNIANAYRAFGLSQDSMDCYEKTLKIYKENLKDRDFGYANLYNNWALLYQEMGDFEGARDALYKALDVVDWYKDAIIQQAITRTNLASTLVAIGDDISCEKAETLLNQALEVFEKDGGRDFHYNAALVAMGDLMCHKGKYKEGSTYYQRGLEELEKHVGKNDNYDRVFSKLKYAKKKEEDQHKEQELYSIKANERNIDALTDDDTDTKEKDKTVKSKHNLKEWKSNLSKSREFYEEYGKPMIREKFPEYEGEIAVGVVGAGSDCFGFDDEISMDHDFGIGFCMWLTKEDYDAIGEPLSIEYKDILKKAGVYKQDSGRLEDRRGVYEIDYFYEEYLGPNYSLDNGLQEFADYQLAAATNGEVFRDDLGLFSDIRRRLLEYYSEGDYRRRLVKSIHDFSQCGQSNYARMMARHDYVTANMCVNKAIESAMDIVYLLAKVYAPYYKWKFKGIENLIKENRWTNRERLRDLQSLLVELSTAQEQKKAWKDVIYNSSIVNYQDKKLVLIDKIAQLILNELKDQQLVYGEDVFLQNYESQILRGRIMDNVTRIIEIEWEMFDKVKNEGGRADCQDDWNTFSLMRRSQYMAWSKELQESYLKDLEIAKSKGWNMIMEKYARMMKSTCPEKYEELKDDLPEITEDRIAIQERIIDIQVAWMEEFASKYPKMAGNSRTIRTETDNEYNTSYETYLRGEMSTYSERTFVMYGRFVTGLYNEGKNLAYEIMNNTALGYGYDSVEDAERKL